MNDEPHSHKKATVALVAVLLLAYVGSYLWMRQRPIDVYGEGFRAVETPMADKWNLDPTFFDHFYGPLRKLDEKMTGIEVHFVE